MNTLAKFDAQTRRRRSMIAKVHVAKKDLCLTDDEYRDVLFGACGKLSAADCSDDELEAALRAFGKLGFTAKASRKAKAADHPAARKARALWISLARLGAVRDGSEAALESFARRQLGVAQLQWADQARAYKLIEALKAMAERNGWSQSTEGLSQMRAPHILKQRLCRAILKKLVALDLAPVSWTVERAAFEFGGVEIVWLKAATEPQLDMVAKALGNALAGPHPLETDQ